MSATVLPLDGRFGPRTEAAVKAYPTQRQFVVDGIVGPQTWGSPTAAAHSGPRRPGPAFKPGDGSRRHSVHESVMKTEGSGSPEP